MQTVSSPSTIPPYTPCPGGFITVQTLDDGRLMVESWRINSAPYDSLQPYTEPVHHCITSDRAEALRLVGEFTADIARINSRLIAT